MALDKPAFFTAHSLGAWKREQMVGNPDELDRKYKFSHRISEELRIFKSVRAQTVTTEIQKERLEKLYGFESEVTNPPPPAPQVTAPFKCH